MKHLYRHSKPQSIAGAVIQSVFGHLNFIIHYICHPALLGLVMPKQAIGVLVAALLPTGKGLGKITCSAQRLINPTVPAKFFTVVIGQGLEPSLQRGCALL